MQQRYEMLTRIRRCWDAISQRPALLLTFIVAMAAFLRLWHYDFDQMMYDMPLTHDSYAKLLMAQRVAGGYLQPLHYLQPYFLAYTTGALIRVAGYLGVTDTLSLWKLGSLYMIALSGITTLTTAFIGRRLFRDWRPALLGAAWFGVIPVSVIGSRYLKEDIPLMFVTCLALLWLLRILQQGGWHDYLVGGLLIGIAAGTKYAAFGMIPFFVAAHVIRAWNATGGGTRTRRMLLSPRFGAGLLAIPAGFLLVNPYVLAEWGEFSATLASQAEYAGRGHNDGTAISGRQAWWTFYLRYAIAPGMTIPATVAAVAGLPLLLWKKRDPGVYLAVAWVIYTYLGIESSPAKPFPFFARYLHPIFPMLCLSGAFAIHTFNSTARGKFIRAAALTFGLACFLTPLSKTVLLNDNLRKDTRLVGSRWIDENIPSGSVIYLVDAYYSPRPSQNRFKVEYLRRIYECPWDKLRESRVDYVVLNSFRADRYQVARKYSENAEAVYQQYEKIRSSAELVKEIRPRLPWQTYAFHNPVIWIYRLPWATRPGDLNAPHGHAPTPELSP